MSPSCPLAVQLTQWSVWVHDQATMGYRRAIHHSNPAPHPWLPEPDLERLDRAIAQTSEEVRRILESRYLSSRPDHHSARRLGCSLSTYRRRVRAAHSALEAILGNVAGVA
jgi:DNA-directed RNA polymerase specialized sigma24 family protein